MINTFRFATWNINSVRARKDLLLEWLADKSPDVLCLQETKITDADFAGLLRSDLASAGYKCCWAGEKSYRGVAILSRYNLRIVCTSLSQCVQIDSNHPDSQMLMQTIAGARYIECLVDCPGFQLCLASVYAPSVQSVLVEDKFRNKCLWFECLAHRATQIASKYTFYALLGDFNVAPHSRDVKYQEKYLEESAVHPLMRGIFRKLLNAPLLDAMRTMHRHDSNIFSYWSYQGGSFMRNDGLLIDHLLLSPACAGKLQSCTVDVPYRNRNGCSDHAPLLCDICLPINSILASNIQRV